MPNKMLLALVVLAWIVGIIVYAEVVYDGDYRCVVAECRIVKK